MCLKFIFLLALFALITQYCLAMKTCNNAYGYRNGYCVYKTQCQHFQGLNALKTRTNAMLETFKNSFCNQDDERICCVEADILQIIRTSTTITSTSTTTTTPTTTPTPKPTTTTTIDPKVINAKRVKGLKIINSYKKICGLNHYHKIAKGHEVRIGQFPWMALLVSDGNDTRATCGGSLITKRHVLTAAHCFNTDWIQKVRLGVHHISRNVEYQYGSTEKRAIHVETYEIINKIVHSEYNPITNYNDIALITLDRDVNENGKFKDHIVPICLPTGKILKKKQTKYLIAGWGLTEKKTHSDVLMKANVNITSLEFCSQSLTEVYKKVKTQDNQICAFGEKMQNSCRGDSGGPLFYYNQIVHKYVQHGVTSFGNKFCGEAAAPTLYTKVSDFVDWIAVNIA